jgi:hypothetical protein
MDRPRRVLRSQTQTQALLIESSAITSPKAYPLRSRAKPELQSQRSESDSEVSVVIRGEVARTSPMKPIAVVRIYPHEISRVVHDLIDRANIP